MVLMVELAWRNYFACAWPVAVAFVEPVKWCCSKTKTAPCRNVSHLKTIKTIKLRNGSHSLEWVQVSCVTNRGTLEMYQWCVTQVRIQWSEGIRKV